MKSSVLYASLFLCMASYCSALECYVCNSAFHTGCDQSPVPRKYLVNCTLDNKLPLMPSKSPEEKDKKAKRGTAENPGALLDVTIGSPTSPSNFTMCRKLIITIPEQDNGNVGVKPAHTRVFRSCGWSPDSSLTASAASACKYGTGEGIQNYMCVCTENGCNAAGSLNVPKTFILFTVISSFFVWAIK